MSLTIDLWLALTGALAGLSAAQFARGRGRLFAAAAIGAAVAVALGFLRGFV